MNCQQRIILHGTLYDVSGSMYLEGDSKATVWSFVGELDSATAGNWSFVGVFAGVLILRLTGDGPVGDTSEDSVAAPVPAVVRLGLAWILDNR